MKRAREGREAGRRRLCVFNISLLTFRHPTLTQFNRVHACLRPLAGVARGHKHHPAREARQETRRRAKRRERAALYTARSAQHAAGGTRRRNIPEREKGHGAGKTADRRAPTGGRTRTTGAGRDAAPTTAAHRSGERREEMKKACEARRMARRESIPLSRRGAGKPTEGGQTATGRGGGGERSLRAPRRDKAHPRPKGRGKRRPALRARRTAHGEGERAAGSAKRRAEHAPSVISKPNTRHPTAGNMTRMRFLARPAGRNAPRNMNTRPTHPDAPTRRRGRAHRARPARRSCSRAVVHAQLFSPHGDGRKEGAPPLGAAAGTAGGARIGRALRRGRGVRITKNSPRISAKGATKN